MKYCQTDLLTLTLSSFSSSSLSLSPYSLFNLSLLIIFMATTMNAAGQIADNSTKKKIMDDIINIESVLFSDDHINSNIQNKLEHLSSYNRSRMIGQHQQSKPLRHRFELISNFKPIHMNDTDDNITHILMPNHHQHRTPTTFRPSSSILYLHPPKPRHIESIESILTFLNLTTTKILIEWKVIVHLRVNKHKRQVDAKVEEEQNPLHYNIYLRRYGFTNREKFTIIDKNNTLDPPITENQTYHYQMNGLEQMNAYEFCLQSVNGGQIRETEQIRQQYPINAQTELAGRNNPLFICKEILMPPPITLSLNIDLDSKITGRSNNQLEQTSGSMIEVSEDATDAFVLYTAITSGSTTVLILVIITIFCCCRCRKKVKQENYHRTLVYDRVGIHPYETANVIVPYSGYGN